MPSCAVATCKNTTNTKGEKLSFFTFPTCEKVKKKWIVACRRKDQVNDKIERICSIHFKKEDFENYTQWKLGFFKPILLKNAVPTKNLVQSHKINQQVKTKRQERCEKRNIRKNALARLNSLFTENSAEGNSKCQNGMTVPEQVTNGDLHENCDPESRNPDKIQVTNVNQENQVLKSVVDLRQRCFMNHENEIRHLEKKLNAGKKYNEELKRKIEKEKQSVQDWRRKYLKVTKSLKEMKQYQRGLEKKLKVLSEILTPAQIIYLKSRKKVIFI